MTNPDEPHYLVMSLTLWDRTKIEFSPQERMKIAATGSIDLDGTSIVGYRCIGWVPVFESLADAEEYQSEVAPTASIAVVGRQIEEP